MNIILIGMPGCGKSTVGVLLAKSLLRDFVDTDLVLQNTYGKSLCDIINEEGLDAFKQKENTVLRELHCDNCVIATGGSAVYCEEGMQNLKANGKIIYLNLSPATVRKRIHNITTRGIAMDENCTLEQLYAERAPLYARYADITLDCENMTTEECVSAIVKAV